MKHFLFTLAITSMMLCPMGAEAQETKEMKYPQAEWTKAGDILMHTPGQELFNGVIHPKAGLFEDYFDVDKGIRLPMNTRDISRCWKRTAFECTKLLIF